MYKKYIILLLELIFLVLVLIYFRKEHFKSFIKKKSKNKINYYTNLHSSNTNMLEIMCLDSLNKNYKCQCKKKKNHFPEILTKSEDDKKHIIEMTHLGKSIASLTSQDVAKLNKKKLELNSQINCILSNLRRSKVYHSDMHITGKNMTITDDGDLGLIDFDISYIDNFKAKRSSMDKLIKRSKETNGDSKKNSYEQFYKILHKKGLM